MPRVVCLLAVAGLACASPAVGRADWSAPQDLGPAADGVTPSGVLPGAAGTALLAWTADFQPPGGGVNVQPSLGTDDGHQGRTGLLSKDASAHTAARVGRTVVAGPVALPDGTALLLTSQVLGGDPQRSVRLTLDRVAADGTISSSRTLVARTRLASTALAADARGRVVAAWAQVTPSATERGPHAFEDRYALRALSVSADGAPGRIRTLERTYAFEFDHGGQVAAAVGRDGRGAIAFATARGRFRTVDVFFRSAGGTFGHRFVAGPHEGFAALAATFSAAGRAVVAWGGQDGGEEANKPWRIRAAVSSPRLRSIRLETLDPGNAVERPVGTVATTALPDGRVAVGWSGIVGRSPRSNPVRVAMADAGGHLGAAQDVAADGALGGLAASRDGALLATWSTVGRSAAGAPLPTQALAALRAPGEARFGSPEAIAPPDIAGPPLASFLPDGRAVAAWSARPGGRDPSSGVDRTAVLRVSVRTPPA